MTTNEIIGMLIAPVGGLLIGVWAYWIATRPEKPKTHN